MVHPVVTDENPTPGADNGHPLVVLRVSREMALKILHPCRKSQNIQRPRERGSNVPVEEQDGGVKLVGFACRGGGHLRRLWGIVQVYTLE